MNKRQYTVTYDREYFWRWDHFTLTMCQGSNYGNEGNWFYSFRGGLNGFHARMAGAEHHYNLMHAWIPQTRSTKETEYHLATFFFQIDSAIECLVFALNSMGYAIEKNGFRRIDDSASLRRISPLDILGDINKNISPLKGYSKIFPKTSNLWASKRDLFTRIFEQHDVSKHRHTIYVGGSMRNDPPPGFWESLRVPNECRAQFMPVREVILGNDLKQPLEKRKPQAINEFVYLEEIAVDFFELMTQTGLTILEDCMSNIKIFEELKNA